MGLKLLLADDETEYVDTLAERLELRGYEVKVVHDGTSAGFIGNTAEGHLGESHERPSE